MDGDLVVRGAADRRRSEGARTTQCLPVDADGAGEQVAHHHRATARGRDVVTLSEPRGDAQKRMLGGCGANTSMTGGGIERSRRDWVESGAGARPRHAPVRTGLRSNRSCVPREVSRLAKPFRSSPNGKAPERKRPSRFEGRASEPCLSPRRATGDYGPGRSPDLWRFQRSEPSQPCWPVANIETHFANHSDGIVGDFHPSSLFTPIAAGHLNRCRSLTPARERSQERRSTS